MIVGNDQLFFLCRFSHIFDVSQQLVLTEELGEENRRQKTRILLHFIRVIRLHHTLVLVVALT